MNQKACLNCGQPFDPDKFLVQKYCSPRCREEDRGKPSDFTKRLHDGSRLQSDDFGEEPGDDLVTYQ